MKDILYCNYSDGSMFCNHLTRDMSAGLSYGSHSHDVYELIFIINGDVRYTSGGGEYRLSRGDLIISLPYEEHSLIPCGTSYERYDILFDERMLGFPFSEKLRGGVAPVRFSGNETVSSLLPKLDYYAAELSGDAKREILHSVVREICVNILSLIDGVQKNSEVNPTVSEALKYIDGHLMTISSVEEIARAIFITKSHLHHLFAEHHDTTPKRYITGKRLELAKKQIENGARPTDIYSRFGFSDYSSFFRAYKKHFGAGPSVKVHPIRIAVTPENTIVRSLMELP